METFVYVGSNSPRQGPFSSSTSSLPKRPGNKHPRAQSSTAPADPSTHLRCAQQHGGAEGRETVHHWYNSCLLWANADRQASQEVDKPSS